jgi:Polysaccharide lyase
VQRITVKHSMQTLVNKCLKCGVHALEDEVDNYQCGVHGDLTWKGEPCDNWRKRFHNLNFEGAERYSGGKGSIKPVHDHGEAIWRVHKPSCDKRAEIRGLGYNKEGQTVYLGWRWRIHCDLEPNKCAGVTIFQWKSYGNQQQNYPFAMGYNGGEVSLTKYDVDWQKDRKHRIHKLWTKPAKIGEWFTFVIGVKLSRKKETGFIELYFNGELQELDAGGKRSAHRTLDGNEVAPKWGVYNRNGVGHDMSVDLSHMCAGRTAEAVLAEVPR